MSRDNNPPRGSRALKLLVASAVGAILFIAVATLFAFHVTENLIQSRDWVEHSDQVLLSLQQLSARLDRIDASSRLQQLSPNPEYQRAALSQAMFLVDNSRHLEALVHDNVGQEARAAILSKRSARVLDAVQASTPQHLIPPSLLLDCRESVAQLTEAERQLLDERQSLANQSNYRIMVIGFAYAVAALLATLSLFGLLFRDAWRRRDFERRMQATNLQLERTVHSLESNAEEARLLTAARDELQLCVSVQDVYFCATRYFHRLLPQSSGALCIINNSWQNVEVVSMWNHPSPLLNGFSLESCCGMRSGRLRWRRPGDSEVHCAHFEGSAPDHYLCMQLSAYGETLGILYVECTTPEVAHSVAERLVPMQNMAELVSLSAASLNLRARLENQSIRDGLTNLFNRHFMEIALERELRRAARQHQQVAVMMLDVDHFKSFNDTYGHDAGDLVLREVAACITAHNRSEDIVCRYGGEEFVIILPEISTEAAVDRANSLRRLVHDIVLRHNGVPLRQITISIGIAMYPMHAETIDQLLRSADRSLYEAKGQGRDRVVLAETTISSVN